MKSLDLGHFSLIATNSSSQLTLPTKVASFSTSLSEGRVGAPATGRGIPLSARITRDSPLGDFGCSGVKRQLSLFAVILFLTAVNSPREHLSAAEREPWTTSRIQGSPEPAKPYRTERVYPHLTFDQPVELMRLGNSGRMLLLEVGGKLLTFNDAQSTSSAELALDLTQRIEPFHRALGVAPHPDFDTNREIFVCYAGGPVARPDGTRLSRFKMTMGDTPKVDPNSEEVLLTWASGGHNGCAIRFDRDGYLYFSAGDGARPYPPDEYDVSQDLSDLRATICRIDINNRDPGKAYAIPPDNPFVRNPNARPEVWAFGFRNPWRFSIDRKTQRLICGDVGWELWELVHHVERGGNYGWSIFEGPQPIRSDIEKGPGIIRKPIVSYPHTEGLSVTGGYTYRGTQLPELDGAFLYGDYVTGLVWGLRFDESGSTWNEILAETGLKIITFSETRAGEIWVVSYDGGIYRFGRNSGDSNTPTETPESQAQSLPKTHSFPKKLSETGLFTNTVTLETAAGVLPYDIVARSYDDVADRAFHVAIPGSEKILTNRQRRNWKFPKDSVFSKTVWARGATGQPAARVETQILHFNGLAWQPYSYAWNQDQTDATLVPAEGKTIPNIGGSNGYRIQSRSECRACHSNQAGGAVAFNFENLALPKNSADSHTQLDEFVAMDLIDKLPPMGWAIKTMVNPADSGTPLELRARSYLAANCAHCHCRGGGGTVALDLSYQNDTSAIFALDFPTTQGSFGLSSSKVIASGNPYHSVLFYRMATSGAGHMPKLWSRDTDDFGLSLVHDWITSLPHGNSDIAPHQDSTAAALKLAYSISRERPELRQQMARESISSSNEVTRGLFERLLPQSERTQLLGSNINPREILRHPGNAERGKQRFWNSPTQQCRNCHRIGGKGQAIGPDLDQIATKRSRVQLLESMLFPDATVEAAFRSHMVLTDEGETIVGLKISETEHTLVLRSSDGKTHTISRDRIEQHKETAKSLMPVGVVGEMTLEEVADLLAYLASLK